MTPEQLKVIREKLEQLRSRKRLLNAENDECNASIKELQDKKAVNNTAKDEIDAEILILKEGIADES